ncbi:MAG: tetratricopeptide repeat protein [Pseudomonadota bacterium]
MRILKRCFYSTIVLLVWLFVPPPISALSEEENIPSEYQRILQDPGIQESPEQVSDQISTLSPSEELQSSFVFQSPFLPSFSKVFTPGQMKLDNNALDLIYQFQLNSGIKNFTTFALFLIIKSQQAIEKKDSDEAIRLAEAARKMAPDFPHPYWALARAYNAKGITHCYRALKENFKGYSVAIKNFRSLLLLTSNIYFISGLAFLLTTVVFSFILIAKYFRLLAHDVGEFLSLNTPFPGYLLAGILVLFPVILGLGPMLVACWWLLTFAVYFTKKEKHVILGMFLILILLPWGCRNAASMILANQPGIVDILHRANNENWSPEIERALEGWLIDHPDDTNVLFTLGLIKKRQGDYAETEKYYNKLLEINPSNERAIGNLANIYLAERQLEKAEETYKKAIGLNGEIASFHYNLYRTYLELYKFLEAQKQQELLVARKLDPELIEYQEKIFNPTISNRMVIDETLSLSQFWNIAFRDSKESEIVASSFWHLFLKGVPLKYGIFIFVIFSFSISFLFFHDFQEKFSSMCNKCGRPIKRRRPTRSGDFSEICHHCVSIFIEEKKIDVKIKEQKIHQVERYQKRQNLIWRTLTYAVPGAVQLWMGFPGISALILFLFFGFILNAIFWNGILKDPLSLYGQDSLLKIIVFGVLFLAFYMFTLQNSYSKRERISDYIKIFKAIHSKGKEQKADEGNTKRKG